MLAACSIELRGAASDPRAEEPPPCYRPRGAYAACMSYALLRFLSPVTSCSLPVPHSVSLGWCVELRLFPTQLHTVDAIALLQKSECIGGGGAFCLDSEPVAWFEDSVDMVVSLLYVCVSCFVYFLFSVFCIQTFSRNYLQLCLLSTLRIRFDTCTSTVRLLRLTFAFTSLFLS